MKDRLDSLRAGDALQLTWAAMCGAALVFCALFLADLERWYLVGSIVATALSCVLVLLNLRNMRVAALASLLAIGMVAMCWILQSGLARIESDWDNVSIELQDRGLARMTRDLAEATERLRHRAEAALAAPNGAAEAINALDRLRDNRAEESTILYRAGRPPVWSGVFRVDPELLPPVPVGVVFTEFFVILHASAGDANNRATATILLEANRPADQLVTSLQSVAARATGADGFHFLEANPDSILARPFVVAGDTLAWVMPRANNRDRVRLFAQEQLLGFGAAALAIVAFCFLAATWLRNRELFPRILSLAVVITCVALVPLNRLSNITRLFDPSVYYTDFGGPLTANAGTLLLSSALLLLGLLAVLRGTARVRSRPLAIWLVLLVAVLGPFTLRDLARGLSPAVAGSSTALWIAIQAALFLSGCAIMLTGISAGRAALGAWRGIPPSVPFAIAMVAALVGPLVWEAPGSYPAWYPALWILAIGSLAVARPAKGFMLAAASVASLGAVTLTWSSSIRQRRQLAETEISGISTIDPTASMLLERFGRSLAAAPAPRDRASLLRQYVGSDIAAASYPLELFTWDDNDSLVARLSLSRITPVPAMLLNAVRAARLSGLVVQQEVRFQPGAQMLVTAPHAGGWVTAAVVAPRSRLIDDDPYLSLVGLSRSDVTEPTYTLVISEAHAPATGDPLSTWELRSTGLHGDFMLPAYGAGALVHAEVEIRSFDVLVQRGTLVLLVDLVLFVLLWALAVAADGSLFRWIRIRMHQWGQSYRALLTVALFGFFVIPAVVFAIWSQRGILAGDRQARELLLTEMLRAASREVASGGLVLASERFDVPLFLYDSGRLVSASDSLFFQLAPLGRRLPSAAYLQMELESETAGSFLQTVGSSETLVGYRIVSGPQNKRMILAAPSRADQLAIDRRRRDLGVLVLFATAVGGLAAFWLSGIAARQLARPIGILRGAAIAIARGEREPSLSGNPRREFAAVFAAFRRMAGDLSASRNELVAARRRTEAILRNVASGVVAFDTSGTVTLANPRAGTLLGHSLDSGETLEDKDLSSLAAQVRAFLEDGGEEREFDQEIHNRQLHGRLTRLTAGDGGAVLTLDDVSEIASAQRVIAWGQMARQVAHEIKNPLTPIRLGVQHLRRAHVDKREDFDRILEANVGRILSEIDRLDEIARSFSRYGVAPSLRTTAVPIDAGDVARDVMALERMGEGDVFWKYDESEESLVALASEDELREVLLNLLENARHAGARHVNMTVRRSDTEVLITVEDDGHGIAEEVLPRVFEPHFSTRSSGSGLGLAISRKLIEGWGGRITVASVEGDVTTVTISLLAPREL